MRLGLRGPLGPAFVPCLVVAPGRRPVGLAFVLLSLGVPFRPWCLSSLPLCAPRAAASRFAPIPAATRGFRARPVSGTCDLWCQAFRAGRLLCALGAFCAVCLPFACCSRRRYSTVVARPFFCLAVGGALSLCLSRCSAFFASFFVQFLWLSIFPGLAWRSFSLPFALACLPQYFVLALLPTLFLHTSLSRRPWMPTIRLWAFFVSVAARFMVWCSCVHCFRWPRYCTLLCFVLLACCLTSQFGELAGHRLPVP